MNIKQINYFIAIANCGSLSAAARECGMSVQALSKAMTDLENEFGDELFKRSHQGIDLTSLGETFLAKAIPVSQAFNQLETMGETHAQEQSKLRLFLCAPLFCRNAQARANLSAFFDAYLNIETEIALGTGEQGMQVIREGGCDALITIGLFEHPEFDCFVAGTVPTGICMAKSHPLARQKEIKLDELKPYRVISSRSFDHFNNSILATYRNEGMQAPIVEPSYFDLPRQFYLKHAVAFMVNIASLGEMLPRSIMVPVASEDAIAIPLCLITLKGEASPTYRRLQLLLRSSV